MFDCLKFWKKLPQLPAGRNPEEITREANEALKEAEVRVKRSNTLGGFAQEVTQMMTHRTEANHFIEGLGFGSHYTQERKEK